MNSNNDDNDNNPTDDKLHSCEVEVTFPTSLQAQQTMEVLRVDKEPTNRVTKSFRLSGAVNDKMQEDDNEAAADATSTTLIVRFESKELKMLRVAISSFFDYLTVVLKCLQEFDTTMTSNETSASSSNGVTG